MKVYPASRSRPRCIEAVAALEAAGHEVTHNWATGPKSNHDGSDHVIAITDILAIREAEVVLYLWEEGMLGANVELGYALALRKYAICVGWKHVEGGLGPDRQGDRNIFLRLPSVFHASSLTDAIEMLKVVERMAR